MVAQTTQYPVLILEATKRTCYLPRHICENITTVTKKVYRLGMIYDKF